MCTERQKQFYNTPINFIDVISDNYLYIKRDDLLPFSFGGNKARKGLLFFDEIDRGKYDCVVTYGSSHSNHCRIVSNLAAQRKLPCYLIAPQEVSENTFNSKLMHLFGAEILTVPVDKVHETIESKLIELKRNGKNPYFIPGGGHGNIGTRAYVNCYEEIKNYEIELNIHFDYIFFASGTGTTHSGLVCGQIINNDDRKIIGISIARKNPYGRNVVIDSIREYLPDIPDKDIQKYTIFLDDYICGGYGKLDNELNEIVKYFMCKYGIPLDRTYTAKALLGMIKCLENSQIKNKNVLFLHTGGTPLFFNDLQSLDSI